MRPSHYALTLAVLTGLANSGSAVAQTTAPATTFAVGLDGGSTAPTYTAGPAPATVHVSALALAPATTSGWLAERYGWDFGDAAPGGGQLVTDPRTGASTNLNTAMTGPVAAYLYERPGTYTVTLTRTTAAGGSLTYRATVIVPPAARTTLYVAPEGSDANPGTDPARPLASVAAAAAKLKDHTAVLLRRGGTYPLADALPLKHADLLVDCYGDATQPLPVLRPIAPPAGQPTGDRPVVTTWPGQTADVTLRHVRIDSAATAAKTAGGYPYRLAAGTFGTLRGRNVTVADVELATIYEGPTGSAGLDGELLLRIRQVDPTGIAGVGLWLEGRDVVAVGNGLLNSVNECTMRAADSGIVGGLVALNDVAQQADPTAGRDGAKAAVTLRTLADVAVVANHVSGGEFAFDPRTAAAVDQRVVAEGNVLDGAMLHVKSNVRHAVFRDNLITVSVGPCVTVTAGGSDATEYVDDVRVEHNAGRGSAADGRLLQVDDHPAAALRAFTADPASNVYQRVSATK